MKLIDIYDFIRGHNLAVVSTVHLSGKPQSAVVEFAESEDLTIIIDTLTTSRKYKNLQQNKNVAVVIGWDDDKTVQMDTVATELSGVELKAAQEIYFAKNERARKWAARPDIAYFAFKPYWVRYSDVGTKPWTIEEIELS